MKVAIEVRDRKEAEQVRTAMTDPTTRAFVLVMGALMALPSDRTRARVLTFVKDQLEEQAVAEPKQP
jgi:hypothetical protein